MKKFDVEITETLQRTVTVEATSQEEAERMVERSWRDGDYVLTDEDYVGVDFKTTGEQELSAKKIYGKVFPRKLQKQELQRPLPLERKYDWSYSGQAGISRSYRVGQIHL